MKRNFKRGDLVQISSNKEEKIGIFLEMTRSKFEIKKDRQIFWSCAMIYYINNGTIEKEFKISELSRVK